LAAALIDVAIAAEGSQLFPAAVPRPLKLVQSS
jgi:hypothetical protein